MKYLLICIMIVTLSSCAGPVSTKPIIEQQNLLQKCTADTPIPTTFTLDSEGKKVYDGREIFRVLRDWQSVYNDCAATHNDLVDTINKLTDFKK